MFDIFDVTVGDVIRITENFLDNKISLEDFQNFLEAFNIKNWQGISDVWDFDGILYISMFNLHTRNPNMKNMNLTIHKEALKNIDMNYYKYMVNYLYYKSLHNKNINAKLLNNG
jgi:hypothetical protein